MLRTNINMNKHNFKDITTLEEFTNLIYLYHIEIEINGIDYDIEAIPEVKSIKGDCHLEYPIIHYYEENKELTITNLQDLEYFLSQYPQASQYILDAKNTSFTIRKISNS